MTTNREVIILQTWKGYPLGVYDSFAELRKGVDYWIAENRRHYEQHPVKNHKHTLVYYIYRLNYSPEPTGWDYAYIPKDEYKSIRRLGMSEGGCCPETFDGRDQGLNLIDLKLDKEYSWKLKK